MIGLHVLTGAALAALVALVCRFGRLRPSVVHALWVVVLVKVAIPPVLAWPWSLEGIAAELGLDRLRNQVFESWAADPDEASGALQSSPAEARRQGADSASVSAQTDAKPAPRGPVQLIDVLAVSWMAGSVVLMSIQVIRWREFRRRLARGAPAPAWMGDVARDLASALKMRRPGLAAVPGIHAVLAWKGRRTRILVPQTLVETLEPAAWRGVLAHELAHIKRRDHWVGWLELVAVCAWWWNPVLWYARRKLHLYAEMACDAWAVSLVPDRRRQYAESLVSVAEMQSHRSDGIPVFGLSRGPAADLKRRLIMIMNQHAPARVPRGVFVAVCALSLLVIPGWSQERPAAQPAARRAAPAPGEAGDVVRSCVEMKVYLTRAEVRCRPNLGTDTNNGEEGRLSPWAVMATEARDRAGAPRDDGKAPSGSGPARDLRLSLAGLVVGPARPGQMRVGKTSLTMEGDKLLWDGQEKPRKRDAVLVATPWVDADPGTETYVSVAVPDDARDRLLGKEPLGLDLMCEPDSSGELRFWLAPTRTAQEALGTLPEEGSRSGATWTHLKGRALPNTWQGMVLAVLNSNSRPIANFLVFWKPRTWSGPLIDPGAPAEAPSFTIRRSGRPGDLESPDLTRQCSLEVKFIEAPKDEIESFVSGLEALKGAEVSPNDVRAFRIGEGQVGIGLDRLNESGHAELLSAPRVTFPMRDRRPESEQRPMCDVSKVLPNYSPSLDAFLQRTQVQAIIADATTVAFREGWRSEPRNISSGIAVAVEGHVSEEQNSADFKLYFNRKELRPHPRGLAFWRPHVLPDVVECPTELCCRLYSDDEVALVRPTEDPAKSLLLVVEIVRIDPKGARPPSDKTL